jgi:hypothetical protein
MDDPFPPSEHITSTAVLANFIRRAVARFFIALGAANFFLLILYPWDSNFYPEGNCLHGPLWLLKTQGVEDKLLGAILILLLLPLLFAWIVKPNVYTIFIACCAILFWIGIGIWIATISAA